MRAFFSCQFILELRFLRFQQVPDGKAEQAYPTAPVRYFTPLLARCSLASQAKHAASASAFTSDQSLQESLVLRGHSVPGEGFEPSRGHPRRILSAVRLPFRHPGRWNSAKFTPLTFPLDPHEASKPPGCHAILPARFALGATPRTPQEIIQHGC
jgi:hypothetical protein